MKNYAIALSLAGMLIVVALPEASELDNKIIARQIAQLGSDSYEEREKAQESLLALDVAPNQLRKARLSTDPETRKRAKRIVSMLDARVAALAVERVNQLAQEGWFDEAIEHAVRWEGLDPTGTKLIPLAALERTLREREAKQFKTLESREETNRNFQWIGQCVEKNRWPLTFYTSRNGLDIKTNPKAMIRGAATDFRDVISENLFVASSGRVTSHSVGLFNAIVFSCDSVRHMDSGEHAFQRVINLPPCPSSS